ncbi:MAG: D-glucuronyl C5-epimerase family protein, partial [Miltoncostaeaceae bacterium]
PGRPSEATPPAADPPGSESIGPGRTAPVVPAPAAPTATTAPQAPQPATPADAPAEPALEPYDPPPAIGIAAEALPPDGAAWSMITDARRAAAPDSQERADLDWLVAFAREAAAPGRPEGRRATARRALRVNAWWYATREAPGARVIARDPEGVILTYRRGHGFMVNPVATMGRWRDLNTAWSPAQLADAMLPMIVERGHPSGAWGALEYFDVPGDPDAVRPGVSAMAQSRGAALFARAWRTTGDPRYRQAAGRLLRAFAVPVDDGGVRSEVPDPDGGAPGTWYPERAYPGSAPWTGGALNGFMVTLIELRRTATGLAAAPTAGPGIAATAARTADEGGDEPEPDADDPAAGLARALADDGAASLRRFLPHHDSGSWSYYGLLTPGRPWRSYLADLNYHCYHVALLRDLHPLYPDAGFAGVAGRWQAYVDARGAQCPAR